MGKQYIDQVFESPEKPRTWEKSPKSCHKMERHATSVIRRTSKILVLIS